MLRLKIPITEDYAFAARKAYRAQKRNVFWGVGVLMLVLLALAILLVMLLASPSPWFSLVCLVVLLGVPVLSMYSERREIIRVLKGRADYNSTSTLSVDSSGLVSVDAHSQTKSEWSSFTHARELSWGVLLYTSPESFLLLRDSDIVEGNPQTLRQVVREKINDFANGKG